MAGDRVTLPHVGALDGLRGVAIAGVVLYHGGHLTGGYLGVDLFLVLSGYLITSLLLTEWRARRRVSLANFWARRARRLLPALVPLLAGVAIYAAVFAAPTELARIRGDALATIGYVANWRAIAADQSYFDLFVAPSPLQHTWSLAIEEQFYVVWPLVVVGLIAWWKDRAPKAVLVTALVLGAASAVLMAALYDPTNPNRVYYGTDTRAFALFAGIAVAATTHLWGHATRRRSRNLLEAGAVACLLGLALMWIQLDGEASRLYRGGFMFAGVAAALLVASAANPRRGPVARVLSAPPLRALGLISYGLYLWHWPVDVVLDEARTGLGGWPLFTLRTTVAVAIAIVSYHFVEMPFRRGAFGPRQFRLLIPVTTAALVVALVVTTAGARSTTGGTNALEPGRGQDVLLLGDSVAGSLAPGLDRAGIDMGTSWGPGCRLIRGTLRFRNVFSADCPWRRVWSQALAASDADTVVLLIGTWDLFDVRPAGAAGFVNPGTPRWDSAFRRQLERVRAMTVADGARLVVMTLPCNAALPNATARFQQGSYELERVLAANRVIEAFAATHPDVQLTDLFARLCPEGKYLRSVGGLPTRVDGVHLSKAGAAFVAEWLVPQLRIPGPNRPAEDSRPPVGTP